MENKSVDKTNAKPFLKWAGGKKQVIDFIDKKLPSECIETYFEPFLGGGAIFFHLIRENKINQAYLGDINKELILTYLVVRDKHKKLIKNLKMFDKDFPEEIVKRKEVYENIRSEFNKNLEDFDYKNFNTKKFSDEHILRASQMIFLNKTCFNGLYRVNKSGKFNVPMGNYKNPKICDEENILNVSEALRGVEIYCGDYSQFEESIDENSFVYLDPPYLPIKKNSFTSYSSEGFGKNEQIELSEFCKRIDENGAKFILSNSDPKNYDESNNFFSDTYRKLNLKNCNYKKIDVRRSINSNGKKRGAIKELLIYNY